MSDAQAEDIYRPRGDGVRPRLLRLAAWLRERTRGWQHCFVVGVVVGILVGGLVFSLLDSSPSSRCYREASHLVVDAATVSAAGSSSPAAERLELSSECATHPPFEVVDAAIAESRRRLEADSKLPIEELRPVAALSMLITWELLAAAVVAASVVALSIAISAVLAQPMRSNVFGGDRDWRAIGAVLVYASLVIVAIYTVGIRFSSTDLSPFTELHRPQMNWVIGVGAPCTLIAACVLALSGRAARKLGEVQLTKEQGRRQLADLGKAQQRIMYGLGVVLTLTVVATAARWQMISELPGSDGLPPAPIVLYGSLYVLPAATFYLPARARWLRAVDCYVTAHYRGSTETSTAYKRARVKAELGVEGPGHVAFVDALSVLGPVVAAALSSLFS